MVLEATKKQLMMDKHNESWEQTCNFGSSYAVQHLKSSVASCNL